MNRLIVSLVAAAVITGGCRPADRGPAGPAREDRLYAVVLGEVLRRGEEWWGYPPPTDYCVAIAPTSPSMGPALAEGRDPAAGLLASMVATHPGRAFHPVSRCTEPYPVRGPSGGVAGLLWVAPLETRDGKTLTGGWTARHDMTEWECTFAEADDAVRLQGCRLSTET